MKELRESFLKCCLVYHAGASSFSTIQPLKFSFTFENLFFNSSSLAIYIFFDKSHSIVRISRSTKRFFRAIFLNSDLILTMYF